MVKGLTQDAARSLYREANNAGNGYPVHGETVNYAASLIGVVVEERYNSDDVAIVIDPDDDVIAVGGDAFGRHPWATCIGYVRSGRFVPTSRGE